MKPRNLSIQMKSFIAIAAILALSLHVMGFIKANTTETAFQAPAETRGNSLEPLIIEGATYFLQSHGDFLRFLAVLESTGAETPGYGEMSAWLNLAAVNMDKAAHTYFLLTRAADQMPYDPDTVSRLKEFHYERFAAEHRLNRDVFAQLKRYLKKGDVRGVYHRVLANTGEIMELLTAIRGETAAHVFPSLPETWTVNQAYAESLLLGQYAAMIFREIISKR